LGLGEGLEGLEGLEDFVRLCTRFKTSCDDNREERFLNESLNSLSTPRDDRDGREEEREGREGREF